ncbi:response regulator transcription factor [Marinobacter panjinensis]|uniref:Response regulator transcription factor n=1 Tax=Marinobacter panjinensis TaxID=2576384 RepID=A0A4U6R3Y2_9GAMM|nr:response regulator transcription factor [Marinobacter panjinensis]MCR8914693.1 response regulator transcription factor [Marinobacter panjinensis]TKV68494.1 response regulator transcription factor [Marinobacter panjinensis]
MDTRMAEKAACVASSSGSNPLLSRVLIVDDHPFFLFGLTAILEQENLVEEVICVASVADAVEDLRQHPQTSLILLDLTLQGEAGLSLFAELGGLGVPVPVVVISSREDETSVRAARSAGAVGFLPKSADRHSLVRMMRRVSSGQLFYPSLQMPAHMPESLTPRQLEVLVLLAEGLPNKRICQVLNLTEHTVKTHLKAIFAHLDAHNRTECVAQARALGLI